MVEMRRGLDKVLEFVLDDTAGAIKDCKVVLAQKGEVILTKKLGDMNVQLNQNVLMVKLSGSETAQFYPNMAAVVQILVRYDGGGTDWTSKDRVLVLDTLGGEVI